MSLALDKFRPPSMPSGTSEASTTSTAQNSVHHGRKFHSSNGMNHAITLKVAVANQPTQAQPIALPEGAIGRAHGVSTNADIVYLADSPSQLKRGFGQPIDPDSETIFPFRRGQLWFMGANVGDQVVISVRDK